ncbi:uncharacterized protein CLUP02_17187 [Colletotrichum lupini]|uniref:Uncharacterized protein n=1 Tax=Colletotrichum lupini TaxID=145971 RepID=A0A9Q8T991_9PEZI|nr:uncharacterized protein CLUP02_17187 [Colletotrichum lupini]UQC91651.1 hypothetical protein CLUP02_17187 [Colletotrichum lupini]
MSATYPVIGRSESIIPKCFFIVHCNTYAIEQRKRVAFWHSACYTTWLLLNTGECSYMDRPRQVYGTPRDRNRTTSNFVFTQDQVSTLECGTVCRLVNSPHLNQQKRGSFGNRMTQILFYDIMFILTMLGVLVCLRCYILCTCSNDLGNSETMLSLEIIDISNSIQRSTLAKISYVLSHSVRRSSEASVPVLLMLRRVTHAQVNTTRTPVRQAITIGWRKFEHKSDISPKKTHVSTII